MNHVMIDIETLSTHTSLAVITQIGAVKFDESGVSDNHFLLGLDTAPQMTHGRIIDESAMRWWDEQEASPFLDNYFNPSTVLAELSKFIGDSTRIWANGIVFDIGNLENLYYTYDIELPWEYNAATDMRTLRRFLRASKEDIVMPSHNAYEDAFHQAHWVVENVGPRIHTLSTS